MATATAPGTTKKLPPLLWVLLAVPVLALLYFLLSFVAVNLFLALDLSVYGRVLPGGWPGYALLGLGLGAAAGAVAAQRRYRLHRGLLLGAGALALALLALAGATLALAPAGPAEATATTAAPYRASKGRVSCGTCTTVVATTTRPTQNSSSYAAANLLRRDSTKAWISGVAVADDNPLLPTIELRLAIKPLAGHRLVGLRLRNGYCKTTGVYRSFGRVQTCLLRLPTGAEQAWTLPDEPHREFFLPATVSSTADSTHFTLLIRTSYPGENHPEVALAWLVPVFEPSK